MAVDRSDASGDRRAGLARAAAGTLAVGGSAAAFVLGGPVNLLGALVLSAMVYPITARLATSSAVEPGPRPGPSPDLEQGADQSAGARAAVRPR